MGLGAIGAAGMLSKVVGSSDEGLISKIGTAIGAAGSQCAQKVSKFAEVCFNKISYNYAEHKESKVRARDCATFSKDCSKLLNREGGKGKSLGQEIERVSMRSNVKKSAKETALCHLEEKKAKYTNELNSLALAIEHSLKVATNPQDSLEMQKAFTDRVRELIPGIDADSKSLEGLRPGQLLQKAHDALNNFVQEEGSDTSAIEKKAKELEDKAGGLKVLSKILKR